LFCKKQKQWGATSTSCPTPFGRPAPLTLRLVLIFNDQGAMIKLDLTVKG